MNKNPGNLPQSNSLQVKQFSLIFFMIILNWQGTVFKKTDVYLCDSNGGKKIPLFKKLQRIVQLQSGRD